MTAGEASAIVQARNRVAGMKPEEACSRPERRSVVMVHEGGGKRAMTVFGAILPPQVGPQSAVPAAGKVLPPPPREDKLAAGGAGCNEPHQGNQHASSSSSPSSSVVVAATQEPSSPPQKQ